MNNNTIRWNVRHRKRSGAERHDSPISSQQYVDIFGMGYIGERFSHNILKLNIAIGDQSVEIDPPDPVVLPLPNQTFDHNELVPQCSALDFDINPVVDSERIVVLLRISY